MSGKAIYFVFIVLLFSLFAGFNLDNRVTISLVYRTFQDVPVFFVCLISFLMGCIITLPFFIHHNSAKDHPKTTYQPHEKPVAHAEPSEIPGVEVVELKGEKKSILQKLKDNIKPDENTTNE